MVEIKHDTANARFNGLEQDNCIHFRGIPYGTVTERFGDPVINNDFNGAQIDCTRFGPRCPQVKLDIGFLLREPEGNIFYDDTEDEFKCLNLDITVPTVPDTRNLPVLLWVHGGSMSFSYGNGASKVGDVRKLVQDSAQLGMPMIVVTVQYRLNIFALGDSAESKNYHLKDTHCAVEWVRRHIKGFGGDPENISLIGESGGAALVHALVVSGANVKRAGLMSGSLLMSPPRPHAMAQGAIIKPILQNLEPKGVSIRTASVEDLIDIMTRIPIHSVFLQEDALLADWPQSTGKIQELIIGDCEFESSIFRKGVEGRTAEDIDQAFSKAGPYAAELKSLYHINAARPPSCKAGALDFLNDTFWAWPTSRLKSRFESEGKTVYSYVFDQTNPWQASARAHHAVDLLYLFEGFDISMSAGAASLAQEMRRRFTLFVNGRRPWSPDSICAFGPYGKVGEINKDELGTRRRVKQMQALESIPAEHVRAIKGGLVVPGVLSLLN